MAVYFSVGLVLLFYLAAVPVKFALVLRIAERPAFGAGASVFEVRPAQRSALRRAGGGKKRRSFRFPADKPAALHAALKAVHCLRGRVTAERLRASGVIAAPDAAATACICGAAAMLEGALMPFLPPGAVRFDLHPDFGGGRSSITLCGIFSVRAGHIMLAALTGAWHYIARSVSHGKTSD